MENQNDQKPQSQLSNNSMEQSQSQQPQVHFGASNIGPPQIHSLPPQPQYTQPQSQLQFGVPQYTQPHSMAHMHRPQFGARNFHGSRFPAQMPAQVGLPPTGTFSTHNIVPNVPHHPDIPQLWSAIIQLQAEAVGFRARIAALEREVTLLKGGLDEGSSEAIPDELLPPRKRGRLLQKPTTS